MPQTKTPMRIRASTACVLALGAASCASGGEGQNVPDHEQLIAFAEMYSAFGGSHSYSVTPYVPTAQQSDPLYLSTIKWELDEKFVTAEPFTELDGAIKLTTMQTGKTTLALTATRLSGKLVRAASTLRISPADDDVWSTGDERFNAGSPFELVIVDRFGDPGPNTDFKTICGLPASSFPSLPPKTTCNSCHDDDRGSAFAPLPTPTQTAGYSDEQLIAIFTDALKPAGYVFSSAFLRFTPQPDCVYGTLHSGRFDEQTKRGLVLKLRSLPPQAQPAADRAKVDQFRTAARDLRAAEVAGSAAR